MEKSIGERIRDRRIELGMTQDELATKLGYKSRSSINKIEKDGRELRQKKIYNIAQALETTPSYIMGWDEKEILIEHNAKNLVEISTDKRLIEYAIKLNRLTEEQKELIMSMIDNLSK